MRRNVERGFGVFIVNGEMIHQDWDHPAEASRLGWSISRVQKRNGRIVHLARRARAGCRHDGTDGTVDCQDCGVTASSFIAAAGEYLDSLC